MTQKDVALYYNVKAYIKHFLSNFHFWIILNILNSHLSNEKHWLYLVFFSSVGWSIIGTFHFMFIETCDT
jgi:hypothetical protein